MATVAREKERLEARVTTEFNQQAHSLPKPWPPVCSLLRQHGVVATDLVGGIAAWQAQGLPVQT